MHELSITRALLDQALAEADKHGAKRIGRIRLLLGEGGGVVPDCVQFYFDQMKKDTAAAEAELEFKRVPLRIRCPKCGAEWGAGIDRKRGLYRRAPDASLRGTVPAFGPDEPGESPESCPELPDSASDESVALDHSTTGSLDHILQDMCSCNAGGEVVSGQELVIESIDVD
jgi:hydrogenase nickel incorporation protein HypA/HybF